MRWGLGCEKAAEKVRDWDWEGKKGRTCAAPSFVILTQILLWNVATMWTLSSGVALPFARPIRRGTGLREEGCWEGPGVWGRNLKLGKESGEPELQGSWIMRWPMGTGWIVVRFFLCFLHLQVDICGSRLSVCHGEVFALQLLWRIWKLQDVKQMESRSFSAKNPTFVIVGLRQRHCLQLSLTWSQSEKRFLLNPE